MRFDNPSEAAVFLWQSYEPDLEKVIEVVLSPGQTAIDIGANSGIVTLAMRSAVGPTGRVISVDPSPSACRRIAEQVALNGIENVEAICVALGATEEITEYFRGRVGLGTLPSFDNDLTTRKSMPTRVTTVDEVVRSSGIGSLALIKIDTDGSECSILEGARATLRQRRPVVVCEFYAAGLRRQGRSLLELATLFDDAGYALLRPRFGRSLSILARPAAFEYFEPVGLEDVPADDAHNILALHREDPSHNQFFERLTARPSRNWLRMVSSKAFSQSGSNRCV